MDAHPWVDALRGLDASSIARPSQGISNVRTRSEEHRAGGRSPDPGRGACARAAPGAWCSCLITDHSRQPYPPKDQLSLGEAALKVRQGTSDLHSIRALRQCSGLRKVSEGMPVQGEANG